MNTTNLNIGQTCKVRLFSYKSTRHYGGREILSHAHIVDATLVALQNDFLRYVVVLNTDTKDYKGNLMYRKGHKIAVSEKDFMI